jgi:hypothetical protein
MDSLLAALEAISVRYALFLWFRTVSIIQITIIKRKSSDTINYSSSEKPSPSVFECQLNIFLKSYKDWPAEDKMDFAEKLVTFEHQVH